MDKIEKNPMNSAGHPYGTPGGTESLNVDGPSLGLFGSMGHPGSTASGPGSTTAPPLGPTTSRASLLSSAVSKTPSPILGSGGTTLANSNAHASIGSTASFPAAMSTGKSLLLGGPNPSAGLSASDVSAVGEASPSAVASLTQPIAIPGGCPSATVFQQVTPFGTPGTATASSLATSSSLCQPVFSASLGTPLLGLQADVADVKGSDVFVALSCVSTANTAPLSLASSCTLPSAVSSSAPGSKAVVRPGKCHMDLCVERVVKIIGECKYCGHKYCACHRLPELHSCVNLSQVKEDSFRRNTNRLLNEKCVADKI